MKSFSFETTIYDEACGDVQIEAQGTISKFIPATMYSNNGDPGDPEEGGEIEFDYLIAYNEDGHVIEGYEPDKERMESLALENTEDN